MLRNYFILLLAIFALAASFNLDAAKRHCKGKKSCLNDQSCQCYCAYKGDFRDKEADDKPIYVKNDPRGFYCYCKQRDLDKLAKDEAQ